MKPYTNDELKQKSTKELLKVLEKNQNLYTTLQIELIKDELVHRGASQNDMELAFERGIEYKKGEVKMGLRIVNFMIDTLIIRYVIGYGLILPLLITNEIHSSGVFVVLNILSFIIYYLVLEGLFKSTIGKLITNTKVSTVTDITPNFGIILRRTLCRLIPFDPISFLSGKGWHDTISETKVIKRR